jgi:hypothetical protein
MKSLRQINTSAALIVLVCFFLPWVQVSCAGARDSLSGFDLSRQGPDLLWFIPMLMGALVAAAIVRFRQEENKAIIIARTMCGLLSAFLMNRERLRVHDQAGLISAQLTGWFWLGFISTLVVAGSGIVMLLKRPQNQVQS